MQTNLQRQKAARRWPRDRVRVRRSPREKPQSRESKPGVTQTVISLIVVMVSWARTYVKAYETERVKYEQLIVCHLYCNKAGKKEKEIAPEKQGENPNKLQKAATT